MSDNEDDEKKLADLKRNQTTAYARVTKKQNALLSLMLNQSPAVQDELLLFKALLRDSQAMHEAYYNALIGDDEAMETESQKFH